MQPGMRARWVGPVVAIAVVVVVAAAASYALIRSGAGSSVSSDGRTTASSPAGFTPSATDPDPTSRIPGVVKHFYRGGHVGPGKRVAYRFSPPIGGRHDAVWATCTGIVYPRAIRSENAVHSLEHGAVWVTYNPQRLGAGQIDRLAQRVQGRDHMLMSPYPGLDRPVSVQSWGHQLKVDAPDDPRIDQFITATRQNPQTGVYPEAPRFPGHPEVGGTCAGNGVYDVADPPPFDPSPLPADAIGES